MKRLGLAFAAVLSLAAAAQAATSLISTRGAGPVKIGMSYEATRRFAGELLGDGEGPETCGSYMVKGYPALRFMVEENRVTRVSISGRGLATAKGVQVGNREANVLAAYGKGLERQQLDGDWGHVLTWREPDGLGLVFSIYRGRVAAIYAGEKSIHYLEGCA